MEKWIKNISGVIPHTNKNVNIELNGKNLIITGMNGAGKTSLLRAIFDKLTVIIAQKQGASLPGIKQNLVQWETSIKNQQKGTIQYDNLNRQIKSLQYQINDIESGIKLDITDPINFSSRYDDRKAVIHLFEEQHFSDITPATTAKGLSEEEENAKKQEPTRKFGRNLEQHLVNLANRNRWAKSENDNKKAQEIDDWFVHFENQLKKLLEDNSAHLDINPDTLKYTIIQDAKPPYTFQQLSAGYRAIFDIYAELLMRTEYFKVIPSDLTGVVLVDEVDAHLHLSLQRLILPFFTESFPKIQFVVTTHSPFVLMSTPDTVVFDLAQNEPITEDLSCYTYSAVMKGLWKIKPIAISLEESIKEIAEILNAESKDFERLNLLVNKITKYGNTLDPESKSFFLRGLEALEEYEGV